MVIRFPTVVERTSSMTCAGQGRYSYCQPSRGLRPSWFAVMAVEKMNCGISDRPRARARALARLVQILHRLDVSRRDLHTGRGAAHHTRRTPRNPRGDESSLLPLLPEPAEAALLPRVRDVDHPHR